MFRCSTFVLSNHSSFSNYPASVTLARMVTYFFLGHFIMSRLAAVQFAELRSRHP